MRKGQAALEFLMTYGWAILVVLAAIAALAYFGVLSPDRFLPNKCTVQGGFSCLEGKVLATGGTGGVGLVQVNVQNNVGVDVNSIFIQLDTTDCTIASTNPMTVASLDNGESTTPLSFECAAPITASKFKAEIEITYTPSTGTLNQSASGQLQMTVQ